MKKNSFTPEKGTVTTPQGFQAAGISVGLKRANKDMALIYSNRPAVVAGMFTTNLVPAHCVVYNKERVKNGHARALIVNSGNANCCNGEQGRLDNFEMAELTAAKLGLSPNEVLVLSTGVIGEPMNMEKIRAGIDMAAAALSNDGGLDAAQAIMTTDTVPKHFSAEFELDGHRCAIGVIAKGSGMINPHLATMFCIFTTDVAIQPALLQSAFQEAVEESLNRLTVDGEMSTNDSALIFANGAAGNREISKKNDDYHHFVDALRALAVEATKAIARDGEGATKLVTVTVNGAANESEAVTAAKAIANSMLVKTAIFGKDPNWGRVVQAAGASGAQINPAAFAVEFAGVKVAENGGRQPFDREKIIEMLEQKDVQVTIDLGVGHASATVFTCDLTFEYITINAEYHT
jgi:glutamate N-acetyltransferase / amino-acid N-acetyltransferase